MRGNIIALNMVEVRDRETQRDREEGERAEKGGGKQQQNYSLVDSLEILAQDLYMYI